MTDRELDQAVAEKVFGWQWAHFESVGGDFCWNALISPTAYAHNTAPGMTTGWTAGKHSDYETYEGTASYDDEASDYVVPHYSTNIAAAWLVVEELERRGWALSRLGRVLMDYGTKAQLAKAPALPYWYANFAERWDDPLAGSRDAYARAETVPLVLCRAALKALEVGAE